MAGGRLWSSPKGGARAATPTKGRTPYSIPRAGRGGRKGEAARISGDPLFTRGPAPPIAGELRGVGHGGCEADRWRFPTEFHSPNPRGQRPMEYTCPVEPCGTRQCPYNVRPQKRLCRQCRRHIPHGLQILLALTLGFSLGVGWSVGHASGHVSAVTGPRKRVALPQKRLPSPIAPSPPSPLGSPGSCAGSSLRSY